MTMLMLCRGWLYVRSGFAAWKKLIEKFHQVKVHCVHHLTTTAHCTWRSAHTIPPIIINSVMVFFRFSLLTTEWMVTIEMPWEISLFAFFSSDSQTKCLFVSVSGLKELPPTNISNYKRQYNQIIVFENFTSTLDTICITFHGRRREEKEKSRIFFSFHSFIVGVQSLRIISNGKTRSFYINRKKNAETEEKKKAILCLFSLFSKPFAHFTCGI